MCRPFRSGTETHNHRFSGLVFKSLIFAVLKHVVDSNPSSYIPSEIAYFDEGGEMRLQHIIWELLLKATPGML